MSQIQFNLIETDDGQEFLTVLLDGTLMPPIDDSHPNYAKIKGAVVDGEEVSNLSALFDISETVSKKFEKLSERVTLSGGTLFFDGDPLDGSVVETVLRFIDEGQEDWQPLVNYIEKIQANPEPHSRQQLFDWLRHHETISITPEGDLIAYKGVNNGGEHPETGAACYQSGFKGTAVVDGIAVTGRIPNYVGAEVTMPRSAVAHDPATACHTGLHVGTFPYARGYAHGAMLAVRVNPRDVVSVPNDAQGEKIRVCRYKVEKVIENEYSGVLIDEFTAAPEDSDGTVEGVAVDLEFSDAKFKVGDFVRGTYGFVHDENAYIGTIADLNGRNGDAKVIRPSAGLGVNRNSSFFFSDLDSLELIDDPNVPTIGSFVTYAQYNHGSAYIGTIESIDLTDRYRKIQIRRPETGVGSAMFAPVWHVASLDQLKIIKDPNSSK